MQGARPPTEKTKNGDIPLLLVQAGDALLAEEALQSVLAKLGRQHEIAGNLETFQAGEDGMEAVLTAVETLPFGSYRRIVLVRNAERIKEPDLSLLRDYAANPVRTNLLVLVAVGLDRRSKLPSIFSKEQVVIVPPKKGDSLRKWLRARFAQRDLVVSERALSFILENSSGALSDLDQLVEKLRLYYAGSHDLDVEDVAPLVEPLSAADVYQLPDRICSGDLGAALKMVRRLFRQEEDALRILFILAAHFRSLLAIRGLRDEGYKRGEIQARLHLDDWRYQRLVPYLNAYKLPELINIYHQIMQADIDLKTGVYSGELAVEMLVAHITAKK